MKNLFLLLAILILAAILRFYKLDSLPPSLEWDEVATGYDAYSILKTGRDQFGKFLPLSLRSIDDYKPPLYTYLTAVSIAVWGWNDFAVRFPAAFLGLLTILTTYGMVANLFGNKKLALISSLLLAVSPWHVNFSRLGLESNSTIFFTSAGVWVFLAGLKRGWLLILSALLFGLDLYLYHNARVFLPLLACVIIAVYFKDLLKQIKFVVISAIIAAIFVIILVPISTSIEGKMRFEGTSIFTPATPLDTTETKNYYLRSRAEDIKQGVSLYGKLFHNQYVMWSLMILKNYLSHFNPNFLVFTSDYPRHHMPQMGLFYFIELPLFFMGLYYLGKSRNIKAKIIIFSWLFIAPIPAAVTRDVPHALRSEIMFLSIQVIIALGVISLVGKLSNRNTFKSLAKLVIILVYFINISFFLHKFLFHFARETSEYWQYGRQEAIQFVNFIKGKYQKVLVSTKLEQPHVFFLYYLKYDPITYLREGGTVSGGWAETRNHFDKFYFQPLSYDSMSDGKTLFVGLPDEFPANVNILRKIKYLNGNDAIWVVGE